jgi:hypothetical protein
VHVGGDGPSCTCRWWQDNGASRGPCAHVLAARLALAARGA